MNVYFISGMCVNCKVFDDIKLPAGYEKKYIEWHIPKGDETLDEYVQIIAKSINRNEPFIIIGYSLGGIIMQEINKFLQPEKNILISSIKSKEEIPTLFRFAKLTRIPKNLPKQLYLENKTLSNLFSRLVYNMSKEEVAKYVTYTSSNYMKWATTQITSWVPTIKCKSLYHIHGTCDQIFPFKLVKNTFSIEGGDHLMVIKKAAEINKIISKLLLNSEEYKPCQ